MDFVEDDDLFLLCSDGLNEEVWDHEMTDIIQEGFELTNLARHDGRSCFKGIVGWW